MTWVLLVFLFITSGVLSLFEYELTSGSGYWWRNRND